MLRCGGPLLVVSLAACGSPRHHDRGPGEDIDVVLDVPRDDGWDPLNAGYTPDCQGTAACVLGPSVGGVVGIGSAAELERLSGVRCVFGPLTIEGSELEDLSGLEALEIVCGALSIRDNVRLVETRGLESLAYAAAVTVASNPMLVRLQMPALVETGNIESSGNAALTAITTPDLRIVDRIRSTDDDALVTLSMPSLEQAHNIIVREAASFQMFDLPQLERVDLVSLRNNAAMLDAPSLPFLADVHTIELIDNPVLVALSGLEGLGVAEFVKILNNAVLDQTGAESVASGLGERSKVAGNAGWVAPVVCPFADFECDAIGCEGTDVCAEGSDEDDCCACYDSCPPPGPLSG